MPARTTQFVGPTTPLLNYGAHEFAQQRQIKWMDLGDLAVDDFSTPITEQPARPFVRFDDSLMRRVNNNNGIYRVPERVAKLVFATCRSRCWLLQLDDFGHSVPVLRARRAPGRLVCINSQDVLLARCSLGLRNRVGP